MSGWVVIDEKSGKLVAENLSRNEARVRAMRLRTRGRVVTAIRRSERQPTFRINESLFSRVVTDLLR